MIPRIWIIGSNSEHQSKDTAETGGVPATEEVRSGKGLFFFNTISDDLLPDWSENKIEDQNEKIIELLNRSNSKPEAEQDDKG